MSSRSKQVLNADRPKSKNFSSIKQLSGLVRPHIKRLTLGVLLMFVGTAAMMAIPQYVKNIFDDALVNKDVSQLNQTIVVMLVIVVMLIVSLLARMIIIRYTANLIMVDLRKRTYSHVLGLGVEFFESQRTGEVVTRIMSDISVIRETISTGFPMLIRGGALAIATLVALFITSVKLTSILLLSAPVIIFLAIRLGKRWRVHAREIQARYADAGAQVEESISGIRTVNAFNQLEVEQSRFNVIIDDCLAIVRRLMVSFSTFFSFSIFIGFVGLVVVLWIGGMDVINGDMTSGEMMAYLLYLAFMGDAVSNLGTFYPTLQTTAGATERVFELLSYQPQVKQSENPLTLEECSGGRNVNIENLYFSYSSRPEFKALDDVSLSVKKGETVALVGPSGAGKSTVFSMILRYYDANSGAVKIDGKDVKDLSFESLREAVGVVAQDCHIFSTTVLDNIRYGAPQAAMQEVEKAAKIAQAHEFIQDLENGYETMVGEKGVRLSGGQKQRIAIARTILRNPQVLLLDEATSNLDAESEYQVQKAFVDVMKNRTTLVIAHRLATVQAADRIVVMDKGRIIASGTHEQLLKNCDLYRGLAELQFIA